MKGLASQERIAGSADLDRRAPCAFESPAWFVIRGSPFEPLVVSLRTQPPWTGDPKDRATQGTCRSGSRSN